jgi:hypothetical protein
MQEVPGKAGGSDEGVYRLLSSTTFKHPLPEVIGSHSTEPAFNFLATMSIQH